MTEQTRNEIRLELLRLARLEDEQAKTEAQRVHYWEHCPDSVQGHRTAALVLRYHADQFLPCTG
jgi:hypothetical protein